MLFDLIHQSIITSQEMSAQEARKMLPIDRTKTCFAFPNNVFPAFLTSVMRKHCQGTVWYLLKLHPKMVRLWRVSLECLPRVH